MLFERDYKFDYWNRSLQLRKDIKKLNYKYFIYSCFSLNKIVSILFWQFLKWFRLNYVFTKTKNRCLITSRPKGFFRLVRMSRMCVKVLVIADRLVGIRRAVW